MSLQLNSIHINILRNKRDVNYLFTELDIAFESLEGITTDELSKMVFAKYSEKRNRLNTMLEDYMSTGNQQAENNQRNYNAQFDARYKHFEVIIDNLEFEKPVPPVPTPPRPKRSIVPLIIRSSFILAVAATGIFAFLKIKNLRAENIRLQEKRQAMAVDQAKRICDSVNTIILNQTTDSLEENSEQALRSIEERNKNDVEGLKLDYRKRLNESDQKYINLQVHSTNQAADIKRLKDLIDQSGKESILSQGERTRINRELEDLKEKNRDLTGQLTECTEWKRTHPATTTTAPIEKPPVTAPVIDTSGNKVSETPKKKKKRS